MNLRFSGGCRHEKDKVVGKIPLFSKFKLKTLSIKFKERKTTKNLNRTILWAGYGAKFRDPG